MNRLSVIVLCVAVSCTHAPLEKPQEKPQPGAAPVPVEGVQVVPISAEAPRAVPMDAPAADPADDLQTYGKAISRAIRARLVLPGNVPDAASAIYEITLLRNGAVANVRAVRPSGYPAYDAAIRGAIRRAQPFPQWAGADAVKPTRVRLTFKVRD
jgi:TonB family protein